MRKIKMESTVNDLNTKNFLKLQFKNIQEFPNPFGINSLNMLILLNIPKHGGMRNVMTN